MLLYTILACGSNEVTDIEDGTYALDTFQLEFGLSEEVIAVLETLNVRIEGESYSLELAETEIASGTLELRAEDDWGFGCPTNFSAVSLMTYNLDTSFELEGMSYENPVIAPSCSQGGPLHISEYGNGNGGSSGCFDGVCLTFSK